MPSDRVLSTADARRASVLRAGVRAFADRGYFGTTTTEVAEAAGISQAYVYRLFPDKEALFVAVTGFAFGRVAAELRRAASAVEGAASSEVLSVMGDAYARLIADRDLLMVQLHAQTAAASVSTIRDAVRAGLAELVELVRAASGADAAAVQQFFALGFLCHAITAISADDVDERWATTLAAGIQHYPAPNAGS